MGSWLTADEEYHLRHGLNSDGHPAKIGFMNDLDMGGWNAEPTHHGKVDGWQPIDTCPKVGGVYYSLWNSELKAIEVMRFDHTKNCYIDRLDTLRSKAPFSHWREEIKGPK